MNDKKATEQEAAQSKAVNIDQLVRCLLQRCEFCFESDANESCCLANGRDAGGYTGPPGDQIIFLEKHIVVGKKMRSRETGDYIVIPPYCAGFSYS